MASNIDINLVARTSDFETNMKKATQIFENLASKGTDASKALAKSFQQINKVSKDELTDLQKAFNALQIKGDFGISAQKDKIVEAKRFYIQQFQEIKNNAQSSAAEIERAWVGLKNAFGNIDKLNGGGAKPQSDYKQLANAQAEALKLNEKFNYDRLRADEAMYAEAQRLNQKHNYDKLRSEEQMYAEAYALNQKYDYNKIQSQIKMFEEAISLNQKYNYDKLQNEKHMLEEAYALNSKFNYDKQTQELKMYEEAILLNQKFNYDKLQNEKRALEEAYLMNQKFNYEKEQAQIRMYEEAVLMDQKRTHSMQIEAAKQAAIQAANLAKFGPNKGAFDTLGMKSSFQINSEKRELIAAFAEIKKSGVYSAQEIESAFAKLKAELRSLGGVKLPVEDAEKMVGHTGRMNANIFASIAMIAKMQIMFSVINSTMSAIGRAPGAAVDAIEDFNASIVGNAAMITSMQRGLKDVGKAYQENKEYATAVQNVLVKMDAETSASAKNLNDMNRQFIQQGIILDTNNKKQVEGFKAIANALSAITTNDPNKDMQFAQEIRALRDFQDKGSNRFVQMLAAQGVTKEMVNDWKKIGAETNNAGYALEKLLPYLQGFAAAQGDINNLWTTVKSTLGTIRDEVLRGGLSQGFAEIVEKMKEISKYASDNKEKIQAMLRDGFQDAKEIAKVLWGIGKAVAYVSEPLMWAAIAAGIYKGVTAMRAFAAEMTIATGGMNLLIAGAATLALYGYKEFKNATAGGDRVEAIKKLAGPNNQFKMGGLTVENLNKILQQQPLASNEDIVKWRTTPGALSWEGNGSRFNMNNQMIEWLKASDIAPAPYPGNINTSTGKDKKGTDPAIAWNSFTDQYNSFMISGEEEPLARKLLEIQKKADDLVFKFGELDASKKKAFDIQNAAWGGTVGAIRDEQRQNESRAIDEAMHKRMRENNEEEKHFRAAIAALQKKSDAESKKARQEKAALAEAEIQDLIEQINLEERLNKISGPEAVARRIPLEQKIVNIRKELLGEINSASDPTAWRTAFRAVTAEQAKVLEDIKRQYDRTFSGGVENALKSIQESASNSGQQIQTIFKSAFDNAIESLMNFTRTGKFELGKFTISILEMIERIALEKAMAGIVGNLMSGFGGMFSSPINTGILAGSGGGLPASVGGYQGINIPELATGTNHVPQDMLAIIHKGEAVVPAPFNNNSSANSNIKIELVNQTGKEMKQKDGGMKFDGKNMIKTIILEAMDSDYSFRNAVRGG